MNLEEYKRTGRARYEKLAEIVAELLKRAITAESGYRLQQIQHRAKTVESLSRRLEQIGHFDSDEIEASRKDLAGCRIIFYTNNDVSRFAGSGPIRELFDVDWDRSKFHQPALGQHSVGQLFQSYNYVLKLKSDRTALLEYREFEGLYCEVQVQTSLNHAWAEMAHDTIYKKPELQGFGTRQLKIIETRLEDAMRRHLLPAGYLFQRIATDVQRLAEGKVLFDAGVLDAALAAENNNDRYEALVQLKDEVLPHFDDLPEVFPEIRDKLKKTWLAAGKTKTVPHETPFADLPGWEPHEVTAQIAEIVERYRYVDPLETYAFIRDIYVQTSDPKSRDRLVTLAERLASHTLQIWQCYGPLVQVRLAEALSKEGDIGSFAPIATTIASKILKPDITGTTSSSTAVMLHHGVVIHSQALETARSSTIVTISAYAESVIGDDDALHSATSSLFDAGRTPQTGKQSPEVAAMILMDLAHAVESIARFASQASFNARQDIESMLFQHWCWNRSPPRHIATEPKVAAAHERLIRNIISLREVLNADEEFVAFKTIVGYKSVFPHQWEEGEMDFERDEAVRNQRQDELAESITPENWSIWKSRLATAASVKSNDLATFPPYERFLSAIAARQPKLVFELLEDRSILPNWTIHPIACALLDGEMRVEVEALLGRRLDDGHFVSEIAGLIASASGVPPALLTKVASRAVNDADVRACTILANGAIRRYADNLQLWRDDVFFRCLAVLHKASSHNWIAHSWHQPGKESLFSNLKDDQSQAVLAAMVRVGQIDYQTEQILMSIALTRHQMVLDWFGQRIEIETQEPSLKFDSIPFSFQSVHKALKPHPRDVVASACQWFRCGDFAAEWQATHFLSKIYPDFEDPLPTILFEMIDRADLEDLSFIASSLQGFKGQAEVFPILRTILASDVASDDTEECVSRVLIESGVMHGAFGAAQTYQAKAELLKPWLDDKNERVANFSAREIRTFENMVASENRRAQEEIAMRKLQYGEPLAGDDESQENDTTPDNDPG